MDHIGSIAIGVYLVLGLIGASLYIARLPGFTWPRWLRLTPTHGLLRHQNMAEVQIHIRSDLTRQVYATKLVTLPPPMIAKVLESVIAASMDLGHQHGIQVHLCTRPDHQEKK